jgi:hypothetical protein
MRPLTKADSGMLGAARRLLDETPDVFSLALREVVVVIDTRDELGARLVGALLVSMGIEAPSVAEAIERTSNRSPSEGRRLVALWVPRTVLALSLDGRGREAVEQWLADFVKIPEDGLVPTLLRRDGVSLLCAIDYTQVQAAGTEVLILASDDMPRNVQ